MELKACKHCPQHGGDAFAVGSVQLTDLRTHRLGEVLRELWAVCPACLEKIRGFMTDDKQKN